MVKRWIAVAVLLIAPSRARAESEEPPAPPPPRERQLAFVLQAGAGTPLGFYGAAFELAPVPWFVIGTGVGSNGDGAQIALMTRARMPERGIGFGLGVSVGPFSHSSNAMSFDIFPKEAKTVWSWDRAAWLNLEMASIETASTNTLRFRFFVGLAVLLNRTPTSCVQGRGNPSSWFGASVDGPPCSDTPGPFLYVGAAVGPGIAIR